MRGIVFDVDHTVLDFDEDEMTAFAGLCAEYGLSPDRAEQERFRARSYLGWERRGLLAVDTPSVQEGYHRLYREYIAELFDGLLPPAYEALRGRGERFLSYLSEAGHPLGDSLRLVARLAERYPVWFATNGLSAVQRGRLRNFLPYARGVFVSEEMGCIKPTEAFFRRMIGEIGLPAEELWMVGDSYLSDVVGARGAGMHACFLNRFGEKREAECVISDLNELEAVIKSR